MHLGAENKRYHGLKILYCLPISILFYTSPSNRGNPVGKFVGNKSAHPLDSHLSEFKLAPTTLQDWYSPSTRTLSSFTFLVYIMKNDFFNPFSDVKIYIDDAFSPFQKNPSSH